MSFTIAFCGCNLNKTAPPPQTVRSIWKHPLVSVSLWNSASVVSHHSISTPVEQGCLFHFRSVPNGFISLYDNNFRCGIGNACFRTCSRTNNPVYDIITTNQKRYIYSFMGGIFSSIRMSLTFCCPAFQRH